MSIFTKIINFIFIIILTVLLISSLVLTISLYSVKQTIQNETFISDIFDSKEIQSFESENNNESKDPYRIKKIAEEKLGYFAQFIDYTSINEKIDETIEEEVPFISASPSLSETLPEIYQNLQQNLKILAVVISVLSIILLISRKTVRKGISLLGISYSASALILLLAPSEFNTGEKSLLRPDTEPYSQYLLLTGVVLIVISQIALRRREVDDDDEETIVDEPDAIDLP